MDNRRSATALLRELSAALDDIRLASDAIAEGRYDEGKHILNRAEFTIQEVQNIVGE